MRPDAHFLPEESAVEVHEAGEWVRGLATTSVRREPSTPLPGLATGRRLQGMEASGVAKRPSLGTLPFRADSGPRAACGVAPFLDR